MGDVKGLDEIIALADVPASFDEEGKNNKMSFWPIFGGVAGAAASGVFPDSGIEEMIVSAAAGFSVPVSWSANRKVKESFGQYEKSLPEYYNLIFEKQGIVSIALGTAYIAVATGSAFSGLPLSEMNFSAPIYPIIYGWALTTGISYSGLSLLGRVLHHHALKTLINLSKYDIFNAFGKNERTKKALGELTQLPHSKEKDAALQIMLGEAKQEEMQASKRYISAMRAISSEKNYSGIGDWMLPKPENAFTKGSGSIRKGARAFFSGRLSEADEHFRNAIKENPYSRLPHLAYSRFLRAAGSKEWHLIRANQELMAYGLLVSQDPSIKFEPVGESRNEVLIPSSSGFDVAGDLIFKRSSDGAELTREELTMLHLRRELGDLIANPVYSFKNNGLHHLVLETADGQTLFEKVKKNQHRPDDFYKAARQLARIQAAGKRLWNRGVIELDEVVKSDYYADRLKEIFIEQTEEKSGIRFSSEFNGTVAGLGEIINSALGGAELTLYKDANLKNWIDSGALTAIDFERPRLLPAQLDLVNLLEFQYDYLSPVQKKKAIEIYLKETSKQEHRKITKKEKENFFRRYEFAAVQRHLELIGYRSRDAAANIENAEENRAAQKFHFDKAISHLEEILRKGYAEDRQKLSAIIENFSAEREKFGDYFTEPMIKEQLKDKFSSKKAKFATGIVSVLLAATIAAGVVSYKNRQIPIVNQPLIPVGQHLVFMQSEPNDEQSPFLSHYDYRLIATDLEGNLEYSADAKNMSFSVSPLGDKVVFATDKGITLADLHSGEQSIILGGKYTRALWSPDGLRVIAEKDYPGLSHGSVFYRIDLRSENMVIDVSKDIEASRPLWSPDSSHIAFYSNESNETNDPDLRISVLEALGESLYQGPVVSRGTPLFFAWSPDSKNLAFLKRGEKNELYTASFDFKSQKLVYSSNSLNLPDQIDEDIFRIIWPAEDILLFESIKWEGDLLKGLEITALHPETRQTLFKLPGEFPSSAAGKEAFTYVHDGDVFIYDIKSGSSKNLTNTPDVKETTPFFLPGNKTVAFRTLTPFLGQNIENVGIVSADGSNYLIITSNQNPEVDFHLK
ncbi:PD40 domain-containing protein [Candidatus Woesearchaeota archaeon]|nr:PD40 domain-containing protein [Candidatus Woesearchaeota archaeon]